MVERCRPVYVYLLLFYILATSKVVLSGGIPFCESTLLWRIGSAARQGDDEIVSTVVQYPTQSHYSDTMLISPYPILLMLNVRL